MVLFFIFFKVRIYIFKKSDLNKLTDSVDYANFHWKNEKLNSDDCKILFSIYKRMAKITIKN